MRRSGFTLLEITLVLAVIILLAAMVVPSIDAMYGELRLDASADLVRARWADARSHAIDEGVPYRFAVVPGTGRFRVAQDADEFWSGNNDNEENLPEGVIFSTDTNSPASDDSSGEWMPVATFLPDSSAKEDVEIRFQARGARPMIVTLRALTGAVRVKYQDGADQ